jgi:hypothetical protein
VINIDTLLHCLGESTKNENLVDTLIKLGIDVMTELTLPDGEYRAYIERPKEGVSLVFTDEAVFLGKNNIEIGSGNMHLSGIFLYAEGKDGYKQFSGEMPFNFSFNNTQKEIEKELGKATWNRVGNDGEVAAERWDQSFNYRVHVTYSNSSRKPVVISLNKADT